MTHSRNQSAEPASTKPSPASKPLPGRIFVAQCTPNYEAFSPQASQHIRTIPPRICLGHGRYLCAAYIGTEGAARSAVSSSSAVCSSSAGRRAASPQPASCRCFHNIRMLVVHVLLVVQRVCVCVWSRAGQMGTSNCCKA